jgi:alkylation response protein AidB-like acyl-CoA dehydrogenase
MTTMARTPETNGILTEELLKRIQSRAAGYDRDNTFFQEDFEELRDAGYLKIAVPQEFGGQGMNLAEVSAETRRLAYYAPATAVALNMHNYWVGVCADVSRSGDSSMDWLLKAAGNGEIFAAGHAESGNDIPLLLSSTNAEKVDGGYKITGRKSFGSLTPVYDWLGLHAMDTSDPEAPKVVHAFMKRGAEGSTIIEEWDSLGMRATQSQGTKLDGVFVPDANIARVVPAGFGGADLFVLGIFMWALTGFANVYYAVAERSFDLAVETAQSKSAIAVSGSMAHHPEVQHSIAEMSMRLESTRAHMDTLAREWSEGVDYGAMYASKVVGMKHSATVASHEVVDMALDIVGGFGISKASEMERLFRDSRLGRIHPANSALTHEVVGKLALGVNPDAQPRWG